MGLPNTHYPWYNCQPIHILLYSCSCINDQNSNLGLKCRLSCLSLSLITHNSLNFNLTTPNDYRIIPVDSGRGIQLAVHQRFVFLFKSIKFLPGTNCSARNTFPRVLASELGHVMGFVVIGSERK